MQNAKVRYSSIIEYSLTREGSGLMEKDKWRNLGLANLKVDDTSRREGKT